MELLGRQIAKSLIDSGQNESKIVCLHGELGAGKTTLAKAIIAELTGLKPDEVPSPTFTYLQVYKAPQVGTVLHFDLWRLNSEEEFLWQGFEELLHRDAVTLIEWPERIQSLLPHNAIHITITITPDGKREIIREQASI